MSTNLPPLGMLAELTHRCPLQCPYCSNPLDLMKANAELSTQQWSDVFEQAADLGVLQVHLSGGEPTLRNDLDTFIEVLARRGVYTNLITAGVSLTLDRMKSLADRGLDHVQISFQGASSQVTDFIGSMKGAHEKKLRAAEFVRQCDLPLTINAPIHRYNIDQTDEFIKLALDLDAERVEIANTQFYGWALLNRASLMPDRAAVERQIHTIELERERLKSRLLIDFVVPDYFADFPKACMGGWANDAFVVSPDGTVMPCHAAASIPHMRFYNVRERPLAEIWQHSPAFNSYRGTDWMPEPCRSCERKHTDFGGCRCQALAVTGAAENADPVCSLSPFHGHVQRLAKSGLPNAQLKFRRIGLQTPTVAQVPVSRDNPVGD